MDRQHTENLFRRYKGQRVAIRVTSGAMYQGRLSEITNDYVSLVQGTTEGPTIFLFFTAIESLTEDEPSRNE